MQSCAESLIRSIQEAKKVETGLISKGKYRYMTVSDGKGGIIVYAKGKQR